jgi:hypothetical protein
MNVFNPADRATAARVPQQDRADPLPLVLVNYRKRNLRRSRLQDHVTCRANDGLVSSFVRQCDQCDVLVEIYIQEKIPLPVGEFRFQAKKRR